MKDKKPKGRDALRTKAQSTNAESEDSKTAVWAIVFSCFVIAFLLFTFVTESFDKHGGLPFFLLCTIGIFESILAIQGMIAWRRSTEKIRDLENNIVQLEGFNQSMRAQRHDLKNHIQVISALLDMDEADEAREYLKNVSDDFAVVSRAIRTSHPAINALLQAKAQTCQNQGVLFAMDISTQLESLPMESWTFCRILGNLIDNALEALATSDQASPRIFVQLSEADGYYLARVENNGPVIPDKQKNAIFRPGYSSKGENRGIGLAIVQELITNAGGKIWLESDEQSTSFTVRLPKGSAEEEQ